MIAAMFRLGLLQCDSLDQPHVDVDGDYDVLFTDLLRRDDVELHIFRADQGDLPTSPRDCDGWVVPGSRESVYDEIDWILGLRRFVGDLLASEVVTVGICFGHQMIAQEMGSTVARSDDGWNIGAIDYRLHQSPPGERDGGDTFTLIASHQDQVLDLPEGAELLAAATTCPIAGYTVGDRVLTVQAHPEFGPELAGSLYRSRVERIGAEPIARALDSLSSPLDRARVSDWIIDFVRGGRPDRPSTA